MKREINPKLKPLYSNLLRLSIGSYIISSEFSHLMIEHNLDELWEDCEEYIKSQSNVVILGADYTGYATEALGVFLNNIYWKTSIPDLFDITIFILCDFVKWNKSSVDLSQVVESLKALDIDPVKLTKLEECNKISRVQTEKQLSDFIRINDKEVDEKLCFVLMPFAKKFNSIYSNVIKSIVEKDFNLTCTRADEIFGTKPIIEDVWEYIKKANYLIADLTGRNPNVFYELGIAHALSKKVILLAQNLHDVPFDLKHYRCIVYQDSIAGSDKLKEDLKNTLNSIIK